MKKYLLILIPLFSISFGWAMDVEVPAGNRGNLLQFVARNEADIVDLTKRLLGEATSPDQPMIIPPNLRESGMDQQLEWWVNKQCNPSGQTRFGRIFRLIRETGMPPMFIDSPQQVISETALRELDVLVGSGSDQHHRTHSLANGINLTKLHVGAATLARHMVQVKKTDELHRLQASIRKLNQVRGGAPLRQTMQGHLDGIAPTEDSFLSFWVNQEEQDALDELLKQSAFKSLPFGLSDQVNSSPFWVAVQQAGGFVMPALSPVGTVGFGVGSCIATGGNPFAIGLAAISIPLSLKGIPETYQNWKVKIKALSLMQQKLIGLASFVGKLNAMHTLLREDNDFPQALTDSLALPTVTPEMQNLTHLLSQSTFTSEPSFWSHWGKICVAYRLMLQKRNEFIQAYLGLGTIDFITSLNALLDSSTPQAPFCFARYAPNAEITAKACWSPLLDRDTVVANDVTLGGANQRAVVITGPNARGKTTLMRSAAAAAFLASTLSIGSAQDVVIPANLAFLTSINVGDDPARNLSLFRAVTERMGQITASLGDQPARPHLVISDEPFVGTDRNLAETCARELIKNIAQRNNALALFSSHFDVKHLERELPTRIANYHVAPGYKFVRGVDPHPDQYNEVALGIIADAFGRNEEFTENVRAGLAALGRRQ